MDCKKSAKSEIVSLYCQFVSHYDVSNNANFVFLIHPVNILNAKVKNEM